MTSKDRMKADISNKKIMEKSLDLLVQQHLDAIQIIQTRIHNEDPIMQPLSKLWDYWRTTQNTGQSVQRLVFTCYLGQVVADGVFAHFISEIKFPSGREFRSDQLKCFMKGLHKYMYMFLFFLFSGEARSRIQFTFSQSRKALDDKLKKLNNRKADKVKLDELDNLEIDLWNKNVFGVHSIDSFTDTICFYLVKIFGFSTQRVLSCLKTSHFNFGGDAYGHYVEITKEFEKDFLLGAMEEGNAIVVQVNGEKRFRHYNDPSNPRSFYILIQYYIKILNEIGISSMFVHSVHSKDLVFPRLKFDGVNIVQENKSLPLPTSDVDTVTIRITEKIGSGYSFFERNDVREAVLTKLSDLGYSKRKPKPVILNIENHLEICRVLDPPSLLELEIASFGNKIRNTPDDLKQLDTSPYVVPFIFQIVLQPVDTKPVKLVDELNSNMEFDLCYSETKGKGNWEEQAQSMCTQTSNQDKPYPIFLTRNISTIDTSKDVSHITTAPIFHNQVNELETTDNAKSNVKPMTGVKRKLWEYLKKNGEIKAKRQNEDINILHESSTVVKQEGNCDPMITPYQEKIHMQICNEDPTMLLLSKLWDYWRYSCRDTGESIQTLDNVCNLGCTIADSTFADFITEIKLPSGREFHSDYLKGFTRELHKYLHRFLWFSGGTSSSTQLQLSHKALDDKLKLLITSNTDELKFDALADLEIELWNSRVFGVHSIDCFTDTICFYIVKIFGFSSLKALSSLKTSHFNFGEDEYGQYVELTKEFEKDIFSGAMEGKINGLVLKVGKEKRFRHYMDQSNPRSFYILIQHYIKVLRDIGISNMFVHSYQSKDLVFPKLRFDGVNIVEEATPSPPATPYTDKISVRIFEKIGSRYTVFTRNDIRVTAISRLSNLGYFVDVYGYKIFSIKKYLKVCRVLDSPSSEDLEIASLGNDLKVTQDSQNQIFTSPTVVPYNFQVTKHPTVSKSVESHPGKTNNITDGASHLVPSPDFHHEVHGLENVKIGTTDPSLIRSLVTVKHETVEQIEESEIQTKPGHEDTNSIQQSCKVEKDDSCVPMSSHFDAIHIKICNEDPTMQSLSKLWDYWRKTCTSTDESIEKLVDVCNMGRVTADTLFGKFVSEIKFPDGREFQSDHLNGLRKGLLKYWYRFLWFTGAKRTKTLFSFAQSNLDLGARLKSLNHRNDRGLKFDWPEDLEIDLWNSKVFGIHSRDSFTDTICFYVVKIFGISCQKALSCLKTNHFLFGEDHYGQYVEVTKECEKDYMLPSRCNNGDGATEGKSNEIMLDINEEKRFRHYRDQSNPRSFYTLFKYYVQVLEDIGIKNMFVHSVRSDDLVFPTLKFDGVDIVEEAIAQPQAATDTVCVRIIEKIGFRSTFYPRKDVRQMVLSRLLGLGYLTDYHQSHVFDIEKYLEICKVLDSPTPEDLEVAKLGNELKVKRNNQNQLYNMPTIIPSFFQTDFLPRR